MTENELTQDATQENAEVTQERDTHFAGFAKLLIQEIDEQVGAVTKWGLERNASEKEIARELYSRWTTLIAQRAYDLAYHFIENNYQHRGTFRGEIRASVQMLPDLTAWPEERK